jgi:hypothetical protein
VSTDPAALVAEIDALLRGVVKPEPEPRKHYRLGDLVDPEKVAWRDRLARPVEVVTTTDVL